MHRGANPSRIARALRSGESSPTLFKLAASARLKPNDDVVIVNLDKKQVRELFEHKLELGKGIFSDTPCQ